MKSVLIKSFTIILICIFLLLPSFARAGKDYSANRFDVLVDVLAGGDLLVTETVEFQFEGGPFTYVFRELDPVGTDGFSDILAGMDGKPLMRGNNPGQVEILEGNPGKVIWHFNPTSDSTHTFKLTYRVQGGVRQTATDTVIWRAVPEEHEYTIGTTTVTVRYPSGVTLSDTPSLTPPATNVEKNQNQVTLTANDIAKNQSVILTANFAPGSLISAPPQWQAAQTARGKGNFDTGRPMIVGFISGLVVFVLAMAWIIIELRKTQRDKPFQVDASQLYTTPPSLLPPAAGVKLATGNASPLATLFDLAQRGFLQIDESKSRWGKSYTITKVSKEGTLRSHELSLMDNLFKTSKGERSSLSMADAGTKLAYGNSKFSQAIEFELQSAGLQDPERKKLRNRVMVIGILGFFGGMGVSLGLLLLAGSLISSELTRYLSVVSALLGVCLAVCIAGVVYMVAGATISQLTEAGEGMAARWKSFIHYLQGISRGNESFVSPALFEQYLPYAAGAGFSHQWADYFQKQGGVALPVWFHTLSGSLDGSDFSAIVALMAASSTSVSAGGDAGGAGASGGGASGAG